MLDDLAKAMSGRIRADVELLVLPYASVAGRSLVQVLISELGSGHWERFRAAIAFAKASGNFPALLDAMVGFAKDGRSLAITFGADSFTGAEGSDYAAIEGVLKALDPHPTARVFLYREPARTFHPKLFFFEGKDRALLIIGSSNWSYGGLAGNVEANLAVRLDLKDEEHRAWCGVIDALFSQYWSEP